MNRAWIFTGLIAALLMAAAPMSAVRAQIPEQEGLVKPNYMKIEPPLVIPVITGYRLAGQITLMVTLELALQTDRQMVIDRMPRLRHEYFEDLKRYAEMRPGVLNDIQIKSLKRAMLATSTRVLGKGEVREVLIQRVHVQRY